LVLFISHFLIFSFSQSQKGIASYYGKRATGRLTSSGERLHHDSLTCAHRTHKFGTLLKVTNPANDSVVIVKVNDRGPFGRGRIIDLSWSAARQLGILRRGIADVEVTVYDPLTEGPPPPVDSIPPVQY
jgi:rare lipoprotein A